MQMLYIEDLYLDKSVIICATYVKYLLCLSTNNIVFSLAVN